MLREALELWRGTALADVADGLPLLRPRIEALEEARLTALERRVRADLAVGRHRDLIAELTSAYPLSEQLRAHQMVALYRGGRQADALAVFHQLRGQLDAELGIYPGPDLGQLYEAILRADPSLGSAVSGERPDHWPRRRRCPRHWQCPGSFPLAWLASLAASSRCATLTRGRPPGMSRS